MINVLVVTLLTIGMHITNVVHTTYNTHINADHSIIVYNRNSVWFFAGSIRVLSRMISFNEDLVAYVVRLWSSLPIFTYTVLTY